MHMRTGEKAKEDKLHPSSELVNGVVGVDNTNSQLEWVRVES